MSQTPPTERRTRHNDGDAVSDPPNHEPEAIPPIAVDPKRDPSRGESPRLSHRFHGAPHEEPCTISGCAQVHAQVEPSQKETHIQETLQVERTRKGDPPLIPTRIAIDLVDDTTQPLTDKPQSSLQ